MPQAGEPRYGGGPCWLGLIWACNMLSLGGPRAFKGINLLRPSSEAELPVISPTSHRTRGTRQTPPWQGAASPKRALGQL